MLDIGWTELLVIAVILIVVVGPKDLPPMIRAFGKMTSRLRKTAGEFRSQFDEALREAELDDLRKTVSDVRSLNPANAMRDALNPLREAGNEIREDLKKATKVEKKTEAGAGSANETGEPVASSAFPGMPAPLAALPAELAVPKPDPSSRPARSSASAAKTSATAAKRTRKAEPATDVAEAGGAPASPKKTAPKRIAPAAVEPKKTVARKPRTPKKEDLA
ncbi:MAG: Sec-independent protein translocase protein TatB [Allorhizobium sp.]